MSQNIIIMGGGIIGLSCAYELRTRGFDVTVLEARRCGGQASGAAAGMLAPFSENTEGPDAFFKLCQNSLLLYPEWQEQVRSRSGIHFEYANTGSLYIAYHAADLLSLKGRQLWQSQHGSSGEIVSGAELFRMEPSLSRDVLAALYTPEENHIYAPDFIRALEQACRISGVILKEEVGSAQLVEWDRHVAVSVADGRVFYGDRLVASTGAWAQELSEQLGVPFPVYPIRGQICAYRAEAQLPVNHMVFFNQGYLVAKANGTIVCGASEDVAGYDASVTERGIERLRNWNKRVFPFLEGQLPFHGWAGLRPATQDGYPLIGPLEGTERVMMAAGHYRNGILLSPVTAKLVADFIENRGVPSEVRELFSPSRFANVSI